GLPGGPKRSWEDDYDRQRHRAAPYALWEGDLPGPRYHQDAGLSASEAWHWLCARGRRAVPGLDGGGEFPDLSLDGPRVGTREPSIGLGDGPADFLRFPRGPELHRPAYPALERRPEEDGSNRSGDGALAGDPPAG